MAVWRPIGTPSSTATFVVCVNLIFPFEAPAWRVFAPLVQIRRQILALETTAHPTPRKGGRRDLFFQQIVWIWIARGRGGCHDAAGRALVKILCWIGGWAIEWDGSRGLVCPRWPNQVGEAMSIYPACTPKQKQNLYTHRRSIIYLGVNWGHSKNPPSVVWAKFLTLFSWKKWRPLRLCTRLRFVVGTKKCQKCYRYAYYWRIYDSEEGWGNRC